MGSTLFILITFYLLQVVLDQSGMYAATSCTDKTLAIYEYESGELAATMFGHSELVSAVMFRLEMPERGGPIIGLGWL